MAAADRIQTTLLVSHKGVDLHAATAVRVIQRRLAGGEALHALRRCELHTFLAADGRAQAAELLARGRYYNPNKHHYGHFELSPPVGDWRDGAALGGGELPPAWPGRAVASDLLPLPSDLAERLLGGTVPVGCIAVDVVAVPLGEPGPVLSGVVWRLILADEGRDPRRLAERLAVTRSGDQGLLINPHQQGWLTAVRPTRPDGAEAAR
jgi:hypothetical protein